MKIGVDKELKNYIKGELVPAVSGSYIDNYNPATGKVYSIIPDSEAIDVDAAVDAASAAFPEWSKMNPEKRGKILLRIADLIDQNYESLAAIESMDNGKPVRLARRVDIPRAGSNFRFFATAVMHFSSESHHMVDEAINYTLRQPIGIVGAISPWNLPLYLFTWKIAPALAAGNCVIAKPSEVTPMTAYILSKICKVAGLPPGVLNILHGLGPKVGDAIIRHPKIKAITFTGGTNTGELIARTAAPMFKKLSLELGGKNPNIIFADCDFDEALKTTIQSSFSNQGQICLCGSRIFIERSIYDRFKREFIAKSYLLKVGDPEADDTHIGAIVSQAHYEKILEAIEVAKQEGGDILMGGKALEIKGRCKDGWFIQPTIIEGLSYDCQTNQEEIFGPVVTLTPFDSEEEVLYMSNSTRYGLSATVWTSDLKKAHRVAEKIEAGIVWINCWLKRDLRTPFGGMKDSGVGREGGLEALRFFTEPKNVCVSM